MGAIINIPIVGQSYHLKDWSIDCQRTLNLYPQVIESGNTPQVSALRLRNCSFSSMPFAMEENEQLRSRIAELEVPVSAGAASEPVQAEQPVDYNSMTADQLRVLLDEKGITYKARDSKPELIELLHGHSNG